MASSPVVGALLPYQKRWVEDAARFKAGMMSRQSGKTFSATLEIVNRVVEKIANGGREDWMILSRGERQAQEALNEGVKRHCRAFGMAFKSMECDWALGSATYRAHEVELVGGSKITALPANPDTARGFSRNVLLDEFAFHQDSRRIWARPTAGTINFTTSSPGPGAPGRCMSPISIRLWPRG
ncbi:MAG: terminase family protein [Nitrospinota bacterium]|nr:terminase family protein [Nitrospinota bacterium]